jgi:hypothetical protein
MKEYEYYIDEAHPNRLFLYDIFNNFHSIYILGNPINAGCNGHPSHWTWRWNDTDGDTHPHHCLESPREITKAQFDALINLHKSK